MVVSERKNESVLCVLACLALAACSSSDGDDAPASTRDVRGAAGSAAVSGNATAANPGSIGSGSPSGTGQPAAAGSGASATNPPANTSVPGSGTATPPAKPPATPAAGAPAPGATAPASPLPAGTPPMPGGPEDGDPAMPVVSIPDVACGGPMGRFGLGSSNFMLDDRPMIVTYPCNKHAGAPVSFILNLHGTTPVEQHFYQHGYFSAHQFAASHNLIVVTPSSVVEQWGNGDDGKDEPHLMKIIDWVYANLNGAGKFDIRAMWVGGHSWGGGYTAKFGCKPELADKVKGLIMMSGGGIGGFGGATCANKVSVIMTTAEGDNRMPGDQSMLAAMHGCDTGQSQMILNNVHSFWPGCDPGFVHANYYMLGKEHATSMDKEVVESIVNWVKIARQ